MALFLTIAFAILVALNFSAIMRVLGALVLIAVICLLALKPA
jgi:hypothetical protein